MIAALALALWAAPAAAQPIPWDVARPRERKEERAPAPMAQAIDLAFGATFWARVRVSTEGHVVELSRLARGGFYKLELIELVLMSAESGRPLAEAVMKRRKGAALSALAKEYGLDHDKIYESALAVQKLVDRDYLPLLPEREARKENER